MYEMFRIHEAGDAALLMEFGEAPDPETNRAVHRMARALSRAGIPGVWGIVPAFTTLLVEFDPQAVHVERLRERLVTLPLEDALEAPRYFEIPTCYGGSFGDDLASAAQSLGLDPEELVNIHSRHRYQIYCIGFSPGFPLAGLLPEELRLPRRASPRTRVPAGSVAMAGAQTGVYPTTSPGGWHLIGRTPAILFDRQAVPPVPYQAGDFLLFRPIDGDEYEDLRQRAQRGEPVIREVDDGGH